MWRVYYEDGSTWDHTQGLDDIPGWGVICVLQQVNTERGLRHNIVYGCQYYMLHQNEWLHAYDNDLIDYLVSRKTIDMVLVGRMTTKLRFAEVYGEAKKDKDAENL